MDTDAIGSMPARLPRPAGPSGDDRYEVELGVTVAAISGTSRAPSRSRTRSRRTSYTLVVEGTGRQGFVKGQARVTLEPRGSARACRSPRRQMSAG